MIGVNLSKDAQMSMMTDGRGEVDVNQILAKENILCERSIHPYVPARCAFARNSAGRLRPVVCKLASQRIQVVGAGDKTEQR